MITTRRETKMSKPAHKQDVAAHAPGQLRCDPPNTFTDKTLADYIRRKNQQDAFNTVAQEKKLTFEEWCDQFYPYSERNWPEDHYYSMLFACWKAAQENAPSQAPGAKE